MALILADRVKETCAAPGTGTVSLLGASTGFQAFSSAIGDGNTCYYTISDQGGANWEVGIGTYASSGNTLARTTVLSSSAGGTTKANFSTGTQDVFVTYPAEVAAYSSNSPSTSGYVLTANGAGIAPSWKANANGDVVGPASATDNAVARFDGTTGKLIQNSAVTIGDDGATVIAANSTSDGLRITQTGSGNALVVEDSANPDATPTAIDASGNMAIGILPAFAGNKLSIAGSGTDAASWLLRYSADNAAYQVRMIKTRSTNPYAFGIVSNNDILGTLGFAGDDGTAYRIGASITSFVDGTPGTNDMPGRLVFSTTADGASSPTERMRIDNAGRVGIGGAASAGDNVRIAAGATGSTTSNSLIVFQEIKSDVTTGSNVFRSSAYTQAASFTLGDLRHFFANPSGFGAGSTVTNQYGFVANNNLTGATNNYGFYSNIAAGTGRFNFYAAGTADNFFAGSTGFGTLPISGTYKIAIGGNLTAATSVTIGIGSTATSTVSAIYGARTGLFTEASAFTLSNMVHYYADQGTIGAGSSVTSQSGFSAASTLTGATNNYGFYSNIASGTGRYNFYAAGTAANYFAGALGIGSTSLTGYSLLSARNITGATTSYGISCEGSVQSDVTGSAYYYLSYGKTSAAAFTLSNLTHYGASQGTFGAGSTVSNQYGFIANGSLTGATNNYGFYSSIAAGTGRWNFYAAGTAANYFAGNVGIATTPTVAVDIASPVGTCQIKIKPSNGNVDLRLNAAYASTDVAALTVVTAHPLVFHTNNTEHMRIDSSGNLLVGTTSIAGEGGITGSRSSGFTAWIWNRANTTATTYPLDFRNGNTVVGYVSYNNTSTTYNTSSDYRLKENIQPMQNALGVVAQLNPVTYTWKADGSDGQGFIAHELQAVVPDCVTGEKDAVDSEGNPVYQGIDTSFLVATLTAAIKELHSEVQSLKAELATLKGN